jgi:hypothetical protein
MTVELEGQLELGADAVGAGHQHRLAEFLRHFEQRAEPADAAQHLRAHRALGEWLDAFDQRIAGIDIHAGCADSCRNLHLGAARQRQEPPAACRDGTRWAGSGAMVGMRWTADSPPRLPFEEAWARLC